MVDDSAYNKLVGYKSGTRVQSVSIGKNVIARKGELLKHAGMKSLSGLITKLLEQELVKMDAAEKEAA